MLYDDVSLWFGGRCPTGVMRHAESRCDIGWCIVVDPYAMNSW